MTYDLRDYQQNALLAVKEAFAAGKRSVLIVLPTGTGKTICFATLADHWSGPLFRKDVLILSQKIILVEQLAAAVSDVTNATCFIEQAENEAPLFGSGQGRARIISASVQSLTAERLQRPGFDPSRFGLVITDEAHHATSPTYKRVMEHFGANPQLRHLGVTATPKRHDEAALGQVFEECVFQYEMWDAVNDGWLVPPFGETVIIDSLDLSSIDKGEDDFSEEALERLMIEEGPLHEVADTCLAKVGDRPTVIFTAGVAHARLLAEVLNRRRESFCAESIDGKQPKADVQRALNDFKAGKFQFLSNCNMASEGFDAPIVACIAQARPTKSHSLAVQMVGRGTRTLPGIFAWANTPAERKAAIAASAKPDCIAAGTPILTDRGLVPIENVTTEMKVWDGLEFVMHCGIICRGEREVITYCGLTATPDHKVWIHDKTNSTSTTEAWATLGDAAAKQVPLRVTGRGGEAIWETDGCYRRGIPCARETVLDDGMSVRREGVKGILKCGQKEGGVQEVWSAEEDTALASPEVFVGEAEMHESQRQSLLQIRGEGDRVSVRFAYSNGPLGSGEPWASQGTPTGQNRQQQGLSAGKSQIPNWQAKRLQYREAKDRCGSSRIQNSQSASGLFGRNAFSATEERLNLEGHPGKAFGERNSTKRAVQGEKGLCLVYDITNAGPRHRFTANGILVSNCLVLDFVGNSRHKLIGLADVLGGKFGSKVRELAQRIMQTNGGDTMAAVEYARSLILSEINRKLRQRFKPRVLFRTEAVNLFEGDAPAPTAAPDTIRGGATDRQVWGLQDMGLNPDTVVRWSEKRAGAVLGSMRREKVGGFMARKLKAAGVDPATIPNWYEGQKLLKDMGVWKK